MAFVRQASYRRSKSAHYRAAANNQVINREEFHEQVKDIKQIRRDLKAVMWQWLDPKTRDKVNDKFMNAVTNLCQIIWNFEEKFDIPSPSTNELKQLRTSKQIEEGELRKLSNRASVAEKESDKARRTLHSVEQHLEDAQVDNKKLSERCEAYRQTIERHQKQISAQEDDISRLSEENRLLQQENAKAQRDMRETNTALKSAGDREATEKLDLVEENKVLKMNLKMNDDAVGRATTQLQIFIDENKKLKADLNKQDQSITRISKEKEQCIEEIKKLKNELNQSKDTISRLLSQHSMSTEEIKKLKADLYERDESVARLHQKCENVKLSWKEEVQKKNAETQRFLEEEQNLRNTIDKLQQHLTAEKHAKEDALTRLSAAAANKLRDNNPGITDLSDPNRPMKLAEKISELYDNEWTNAMENMEDHGIKEEEGVKILLDILTNVFVWCKDGGNKIMNSIEKHIAVPAIDGVNLDEVEIVGLPKLSAELLKPLKDFRKVHSQEVIAFIQKVLMKKLEGMEFGKQNCVMEDCKDYIEKSIEYCWLMCIQDPPVYIEWEFIEGSDFDTNKFRSYTKGGDFVKYVVWPVLYLHEKGPLLAKGVVQGLKKSVNESLKT